MSGKDWQTVLSAPVTGKLYTGAGLVPGAYMGKFTKHG
jgi:hypothetical protein